MNLHLAQDEKFIDFVISDVKALGSLAENDFCIYTESDSDLKYVKSVEITRLKVGSNEWTDLFSKKIETYARVFVHYLDPHLYDQMKMIPPQVKVIWCFFGHDGFFLFSNRKFLQPQSRKHERAISLQLSLEKHGILYYLLFPLFLVHRFLFVKARNRRLVKAIRRIDYFGHFLIEDFNLLCKTARAKMIFTPFTFNALEALQYDQDKSPVGNNILIGNSATITNNHFEVIEKLRSVPTGHRKIYCPLSYGDREYANHVIRRGVEAFGGNFVPLLSFLPLTEYKKVLHSCGFVFMNHDRSQASDNILINLSSGAALFMSEKSSLYSFLKDMGVAVFSVQNDISISKLSVGLSESERLANRNIIVRYFGAVAHKERLSKILKI